MPRYPADDGHLAVVLLVEDEVECLGEALNSSMSVVLGFLDGKAPNDADGSVVFR